jgi:dTDP-4-dehydrorhamnose reductase
MRLLITGCRGMLGHELMRQAAAEPRNETTGIDLPDGDITVTADVARVMQRVKPQVVINIAAYTAVDDAEGDRERCLAVNSLGVGVLARHAQLFDARLIQVSTDYVYDGTQPGAKDESAALAPLGVYARSKLEGEERLRAELPAERALIVRTASLYGAGGKNFVDTMRRLFRERPVVRVVDDQYMSPTWTVSLARQLLRLAASSASGVLNAAGLGQTSWFELAACIARITATSCRVEPTPMRDYPVRAPRPQYSALDCTRLRAAGLNELRPWETDLRDYMAASSEVARGR